MDMHAAYQEVGSYRAAAAICGTTDKTVKRAVAKARAAEVATGAEAVVAHNYDDVAAIIAERVERTDGRISAKRLLPVVRAAGYEGSARNLRRAVAEAKAKWRVDHHRGRRPGVWAPGDMLVFDWGEIGPLFVFCAVLAWSRFRFVYFADNLGAQSHHGGVGRVHGDHRRGAQDPAHRSHGVSEGRHAWPGSSSRRRTTCASSPTTGRARTSAAGRTPSPRASSRTSVGYVKSDLMIPEELSVADLVSANAKGRAWCAEVNAQVHFEIAAIPAERLEIERPLLGDLPSLRARIGQVVLRKVDRLSCVRFGSARYSVPTAHIGRTVELRVADGVVMVVFLGEIIAEHRLVAPGETAICDDHYGGPRPLPARAVRPKTAAEKAFVRARAGGRGLHQGGRGAGVDHAGRRPRRAVRHGGGPRPRPHSSPPSNGPSSSGGSAPTTCAPSSPRAPAWPDRASPVTRSSSTCPRSPSARSATTPSGPSHEHDTARSARRPRSRAAPTAPRCHAPSLARTVDGGQDPALEARGVLAHA